MTTQSTLGLTTSQQQPSVARFTLESIPSQNRPLYDLQGQPLKNQDGTIVGDVVAGAGVVTQYMDRVLAAAWATYAAQQVAAAAANHDVASLQNAAWALMQYYNALNIPWMIDPTARLLYQQYDAGPPDPNGPPQVAEYAVGARYNDTLWLAPRQTRCIVTPEVNTQGFDSYGGCNSDGGAGGLGLTLVNRYTGSIPARARAVFAQCFTDPTAAATHPTQFLPRMQFTLSVRPQDSKLPPGYINLRVPQAFDLGLLTAPMAYNAVYTVAEPKQFYRGPNCEDRASDPDAWDAYAFDSNWTVFDPQVPQQVRPAYQDYLPWLQAWVDSIDPRRPHGRTPDQVVLDARAYALYRNARALAAAGGQFSSIAGSDVSNVAALEQPDPAIQTDLRAIAATAAAVGAALSTVTFGIAGLVGGAISALSSLLANIVPPNLATIGIDDLERPKPWIERSWLEGSPGDLSDTGPPHALRVPAPPGWTRPISNPFLNALVNLAPGTLAATLVGGAPPSGGAGSTRPAAPPGPLGITPAEALIGGVVLAVAGVGVYVATRPPPVAPRR